MKLKWFISMLTVSFIFAIALFGLAGRDSIVAAQDESTKIEGLLIDRFAADGTADFIVRFVDQADLSAAYSMDWDARGEYVVNTLREIAAKSQVNAIGILDTAGLQHQTMIGGNDLYVWSGSQIEASALAALPEVATIRATRTYQLDPYTVTNPLMSIRWAGDLLSYNLQATAGDSPAATTAWGITDTKANQFWSAYGLKGDGIKVANIDSGVQWNHPALINQFACPGDPDNAACWRDPSNICGGSACDNNGHGTHTMGTMVAKDDANLTYIAGMAPNSTWIACKGCETNSCSDLALTTCADWILAPGGNSANRPDVVNNSWGSTPDGDDWYLSYVNAWRAAGTFPAFSAGNAGSGCDTLGDPGSYQQSFASAAHSSSRTIASFSSRGPSAFGHAPYTKPNISAPGVSVCSTVPTNGWSCGYSGTSMASPHTAGAVALLWSCNPDLVGDIDGTFQLLQSTANVAPAGNCGAPPDGQGNYTYGYGYLDVLAAGGEACGTVEYGTLAGHVYDDNGAAVEGATVIALPAPESNQVQAVTDPNGFYTMDLAVGTYNVSASKVNYTSQTVNGVVVNVNDTTTQDFSLTFLGAWTQLAPGSGCPDWTRFDMEYSSATGLAYLMGGRPGTTTDGTIYSYNPSTNTCATTGRTMPVPISNYTIVPLNDGNADLLCTFGGRDSTGALSNAVQCYNPVANTVSQVDTLPVGFGVFIPGGAAVVNNVAYIFGGLNTTTTPYASAETWSYVPATDSWAQEGDLSLARGYIEVAVVDGKIYAFGGDTYNGSLVAVTKAEVFDPAAGTWNDATVADLATASGEGRGFGFDSGSGYETAGKVILAGGGIWSSDTNAVLSYDVATNTYDEGFPDLNIERRDHAGFFVPGNPSKMFVFGGYSAYSGYGGDSPPYGPPEYFAINQLTSADLALSITGHPDPAHVGSPLTYVLLVTNSGPADATNVVVTDALTGLVTFVSASGAACSEVGGLVTCNVGTLAMGGTVQITVVVIPNVEGVVVNTATVDSSAADPNLANNTASETTTVLAGLIKQYLPLTIKD